MTTRVHLYHPDHRLPGEVMERLYANEPDMVKEGTRLAQALAAKPVGKRSVLVQDLGGGQSDDSKHWWSRRDGKPLTKAQSDEVYGTGSRAGSAAKVEADMRAAGAAYLAAGGPPFEFISANVEIKPDVDLPTEATFDEVCAAAGVTGPLPKERKIDALQVNGAAVLGDMVQVCVSAFIRAEAPNSPAIATNIGACDWYGPRRYKGVRLFGDSASFGISCPELYLCETHHLVKPTPESVLTYAIETWEAIHPPKICCLAPPCWAGVTDVAVRTPPLPGCTSRIFTSSAGWRARFWSKPFDIWKDEWETLARLVVPGATDVVLWFGDGKVFGPAPSDAECKLMRRVIEECAA